MAKTFHLTVARVGANLFDGEANSVTLPGDDGVFTVLANHEAFVTPLKPGMIDILAADGSKHHVEVTHPGVAEISSNQATVLL
jgi:F-type H+-transporting ATPase subunit epsilon